MRQRSRTKWLCAALLTLTMAATVISGCGGGDENETDKTAAMRGKQEKD